MTAGEAILPRLAWICAGGAAGSGARYLVSVWTAGVFGTDMPYGTLLVNVSGSFLIGLLMQLGSTGEWLSPTLRATLAVGVLGGFTTYSSFSYEAVRFFQAGAAGRALGYVAVTTIGCLAACAAGFELARWIARG
jgi:CrcB protein